MSFSLSKAMLQVLVSLAADYVTRRARKPSWIGLRLARESVVSVFLAPFSGLGRDLIKTC